MATTADWLRGLLDENFANANFGGIQDESGRVIGSFTTTDFDGVPFWDRLARVNDLIQRELGSNSVNVGVIMPLDSQGQF